MYDAILSILAGNPATGWVTISRVEEGTSPRSTSLLKSKVKFSTPSSCFSSFSSPPPFPLPLAFLPFTSSPHSPLFRTPLPPFSSFFFSHTILPIHCHILFSFLSLLFHLPLLIESNLLLSTSSFTFHHSPPHSSRLNSTTTY